MLDAADLLARLLNVEGVTGDEGRIVREAAAVAEQLGLHPEVSPYGVVLKVNGWRPGPTLLFCAHLDTVPAGDGWSVPPFRATRRDDCLFGRGAVDDRASCAAILLTLAWLHDEGLPHGRLLGVLSIGEEGDDPSLPKILTGLGPITAGIVGEPTGMNIAVAQRGLMTLELVARGEQGHASRTAGPNAVVGLARDLAVLADLRPAHAHPALGALRITPTRLCAGAADNIAPAEATAVLDVRTTPLDDHAAVLALIRAAVRSEVRVKADRWPPCETPADHPLIPAAREALPAARVYASEAASDWAFLAAEKIPAIKVGPGDPRHSHAADERITLSELTAGVSGYYRLAEQCLARLSGSKE